MTTKQTTISMGDGSTAPKGNGNVTTIPHVAQDGDKPAKERGPLTVAVAVRRINLVLDALEASAAKLPTPMADAAKRAIDAVRAMRGLP